MAKNITATNIAKIVQSTIPHFFIGISYVVLLPRKKFTVKFELIIPKANKCFGHYLACEFSASSISLSALTSPSVTLGNLIVLYLFTGVIP